jgi:hypothetical protein
VDTSVVASIQNILKSGGSDVDLSHIDEIRIYKASTNGSPVSGAINVWRYTPGSGPDADPGVGTERLDFSPSNVRWQACDRDNSTADPDSIGVEIDYDYELQTPLAALLTLVGGSQASTIPILDRTVMSLNPTG